MTSPVPNASVWTGSHRRCAARSPAAVDIGPHCASCASCLLRWPTPPGVTAHRRGALERIAFLLRDWHSAADKLTDTETRMTKVLDELKLTQLATSIPGLSAVGAAAILAETGDPNRFATARAKCLTQNDLR